MKHNLAQKLWTGVLVLAGAGALAKSAELPSFYTLKAISIDGTETPLKEFEGKVALVVNVASNCGFTSQYEGLQKLHDKYRERGFVVLGFPSNDFGGQEPGSNSDIKAFCSTTYGVKFPLFAKGHVKGSDMQPVYRHLTTNYSGVLWNFEKFLIDKRGRVRERYRSITSPESTQLTAEIEKLLQEP